jgi:outer membrane receptor for ferrienterochelin and colicins
MLFSGTFYHSLGDHQLYYPEFDSPRTNNGVAVGADGDASRSFFANVQSKDVSVQGMYGWREKTIPTASFGTVFNDPRTRTIDEHGYLDLKYDHTFGNRWQVLGRVGFDQYNYHGTYAMDYTGAGAPPFTLNQDFVDGQWVTAALDVSRNFHQKHRVTLGTETRWNLKQDQENYDAAPYMLHLDDRRNSTVASFYVQDDFSIRPNLILTAGFRYDQYYGIGGSANPRTGLIYSPWEKTTLKFLYGQAFRAPNMFELYYSDRISEQGNPALQPETIKTTELILQQYFTKHAQVVISGFYNSIAGLITEQTNPTSGMTQFVNLENVHGKGLDFELAGKWPSGWEGRLAYSVQDSSDQSNGSALSNSPKHLPKLDFIAPIVSKRLFLSFDAQYVSRRETIGETSLGGFFVADATLATPEVFKGLSVSGGAYNMFNKRYADPGGPEHMQISLPQESRTLRLKLAYRFKK